MILYWADAHHAVIRAIREQFAESLCQSDPRRPYCDDIHVYMSEGQERGAALFFRFSQDPNPGGGNAAAKPQVSQENSLLTPAANPRIVDGRKID